MLVKLNGEKFWLWRAVDRDGYELDVFLQKRRNKRAAIRFLSRLLGSYPKPRVIVTDELKSYTKPVRHMCRGTEHRQHKDPEQSGGKCPSANNKKGKVSGQVQVTSWCPEDAFPHGKNPQYLCRECRKVQQHGFSATGKISGSQSNLGFCCTLASLCLKSMILA